MRRVLQRVAVCLIAGGVLFPSVSSAALKVGGSEFLPKDLIFAPADPKSKATAEGPLGENCKWEMRAETRLGQKTDSQDCVHFFFKTTVVLTKVCPDPTMPERRSCERSTSIPVRCPGPSNPVAVPALEARILSVGSNADGKQQEVFVQPDGARVVLVSDSASVVVIVAFPDGTADTLKLP